MNVFNVRLFQHAGLVVSVLRHPSLLPYLCLPILSLLAYKCSHIYLFNRLLVQQCVEGGLSFLDGLPSSLQFYTFNMSPAAGPCWSGYCTTAKQTLAPVCLI
jgi:hypothetical protein